ncbi:DUF3060 family protein [Stackebrandtia endophytica]|uniref:DUF3060 family protein n=1 Tax=Stackebrandtia endophytica TaxID=1496996 RepID=A0A543ATC2_9ACTN|nr:DUF3060 domain-containing protein [Stackebrandtia endophytica]TQL75840.1 DUF3060 family protein [Stackebrandtia endophytica]
MRPYQPARVALATLGVVTALGMSACGGTAGTETTADDASKAPTVINAIDGEAVYDCDGQSILLNAGGSQIDLLGPCGTVTINAVGAVVYVEDATAIVINGAGVKVTYGGDPEVSVNGADSTATPA